MSFTDSTAASVDLDELVTVIGSLSSESEEPEVLETPLSHLLLTSRHVYKVKRAVDRGEACFRSPLRRRIACLEELRLNHTLAPEVHLGVTSFVRDGAGKVVADIPGEAFEWAVKMRRLRRDANMAWLIKHGQLLKSHVGALAESLARFYDSSPPVTAMLDDLCTRLRTRVSMVLDDASLPVPNPLNERLQRIVNLQRTFLVHARAMLNYRMCDGRVVDGHGELIPEHIFLERQPLIVDRIEYSLAARRVDALDDLCMLTMELRRLDHQNVADTLVAAYRVRTGDECCPHLEAFYRSLHACTRARWTLADATERWSDHDSLATAESYLTQAERDASDFA